MSNYSQMSREDLIARIQSLEAGPSTLKSITKPSSSASEKPETSKNSTKTFNYKAHPTRHIALLIAYHGWPYSGLAIQSPTSSSIYPTVEGELLKALEKTRLIEPGKGWEGCEFSRCGRTDRGVSGQGQVVDLWVKSLRKADDGGNDLSGVEWREAESPSPKFNHINGDGDKVDSDHDRRPKTKPTQPFEHPYPKLLNAVLPPTIRILAWSPLPSTPIFNSRFTCTSRHYQYAFHLHPSPTTPPLNLDQMKKAANLLIGEHDFRNFCKLDGSKQILSHTRGVTQAWFETLTPTSENPMIIFNLIGTAFLWHQVRHIIAILFLIGSGLEPPTIISDLLNVELHPSKPSYMMGDPLPLTLHSCVYPDGTLDWRYGSYDGPYQSLLGDAKEAVKGVAEMGRASLERELEGMRQEAELRCWQVGGGLRKLREIYGSPAAAAIPASIIHPLGGGELVISKKYHPVQGRPHGDTPEETNRKWLQGGGERRRLRKEAEEAGDE